MDNELIQIYWGHGGADHLLHDTLQKVEKDAIRKALEYYRGNKTRTARHLGISRQWLHRRLNILGIETE